MHKLGLKSEHLSFHIELLEEELERKAELVQNYSLSSNYIFTKYMNLGEYYLRIYGEILILLEDAGDEEDFVDSLIKLRNSYEMRENDEYSLSNDSCNIIIELVNKELINYLNSLLNDYAYEFAH